MTQAHARSGVTPPWAAARKWPEARVEDDKLLAGERTTAESNTLNCCERLRDSRQDERPHARRPQPCASLKDGGGSGGTTRIAARAAQRRKGVSLLSACRKKRRWTVGRGLAMTQAHARSGVTPPWAAARKWPAARGESRGRQSRRRPAGGRVDDGRVEYLIEESRSNKSASGCGGHAPTQRCMGRREARQENVAQCAYKHTMHAYKHSMHAYMHCREMQAHSAASINRLDSDRNPPHATATSSPKPEYPKWVMAVA